MSITNALSFLTILAMAASTMFSTPTIESHHKGQPTVIGVGLYASRL